MYLPLAMDVNSCANQQRRTAPEFKTKLKC